MRSLHRGKDDKSYTDPYRLYNLDVFEYETDSEMAIVRSSHQSSTKLVY